MLNAGTTVGTKKNAGNVYQRLDSNAAGRLVMKDKKFHFVGIGGIGMSGLARMMLNNQAIISGSDMQQTSVTAELTASGCDIKIKHEKANITRDLDAVVISAAVKPDNPELLAARKRGVTVYKYAEMLGKLMQMYHGIAVCGTHGKSTTSAWLAHTIAQIDGVPNFIIGASIPQLNGSSATSDSKLFVAEACEYDRSFLNLKPNIACITNIESDHLDYYHDLDEIIEAFANFALNTSGAVIANADDKNVAKLRAQMPAEKKFITFGIDGQADYRAQNLRLIKGLYHFEVLHNDKPIGECSISLPGRHNVYNALTVLAAAIEAGFEAEKILEAIGKFAGTDRRMMLKASLAGRTILDDYAHHPTEIRASLSAIRELYAPTRLLCIFQPHQYSRTRFLLDDFAESFKLADITIMPEIYFVRDTEQMKKEVNSKVLVDRINSNGNKAEFVDGFTNICDYLARNATNGDVIVTMGAGDIWKVADGYIQWLRTNC